MLPKIKVLVATIVLVEKRNSQDNQQETQPLFPRQKKSELVKTNLVFWHCSYWGARVV